MIIDHICFAVKELDKGVEYWKDTFGYKAMTKPIVNTRQKVKVIFLEKPESLLVKLIEPLEDNKSLTNFVEYGGGFHHICFKCNNMEETANELKDKDVKMLVPPQPGEAFNNKDIAFYLAKFKTTFELIDTDEKAGKLKE